MTPSPVVRSKAPGIALAILSLCAICAALLFTQFASPMHASGGRDFAGSYQISNVTELGDQVRLTFSARVFNYTDSDITGATVILSSAPPGGIYATFYAVSLPDRQSVRLSQEVTVPSLVYQRWRTGHDPQILIEFQDLSGTVRHGRVEFRPGPVGKE